MNPRDDIDPSKTWVIADTHFGHKNIIGYCHRPENFEDILLENINQAVRPGDTLLHLGDLCYKGNSFFKNIIAPKIAPDAARRLLIAGNHDKQRYSFYKQCGFKLARPFYITYGPNVWPYDYPRRISFSHYPWSEREDGEMIYELDWRLHGHIHNNGYYDGRSNAGGPDWTYVPFLRNHINLSVEQTKYKPVRLDHLLDATILGILPQGEVPGDGDAPSRADIDGANPHVA